MTDPSVERAALALFEAMLDVPEPQRDGWLAERTRGNPTLASRIAAMREADRRARFQTGAAIEELEDESPPDRIGAYRIVEQIGRGGMGSVYRGERLTGDFAHLAAIKLIKPGLLSESLIERFQRERQILASLRHPNIAQLYDGGETAGGSPYIIMEYVDGLPLLQWIDAHQASRDERLRLFQAICGAVAFANRNLVVHRDLTPSNVLVTADGTVKLIDFGISKPVDTASRHGETPSLGSLSLTPGFAAPERMLSAEVSTAADIYSLGRLLERMLPDASADKDLQAIIAKATAHDPAARYPSADALAADLEAWRRGFPVTAVPARRGYVVRKFLRRHRLAVGLAGAVLLLLIGAFALTLSAYGRAERARQAEAARFAELRSLARYMIFELNDELARVAGNTRARAALADRAQHYLSALAASSSADDALRREAGRGLIALAHAQGVPGQPNLGQQAAAKANLDRAVAMLGETTAPAAVSAPDLAMALSGRAMIEANTANRVDLAKKTVAEGEDRLAGVPERLRTSRWHLARRALRRTQAEVATLDGDAATLTRVADQLAREPASWPAQLQRAHLSRLDQAYALFYRATAGYFTDDLTAGLAAAQRAETLFAALDDKRPNDPVILYGRAWNAYIGYGNASGLPDQRAEGKRFAALASAMLTRLVGMEANDNTLKAFAANVRQTQSQSLADEGRYREAIAAQQEVIDLFAQALRQESRSPLVNRMAAAEITMGGIARKAGDTDLLCRSYRSAAARMDDLRRRQELLGFVEAYQQDIVDTLARCAGRR